MDEIIHDFSNNIVNGNNDNTYKFALARFILDIVFKCKLNNEFQDLKFSYGEIAEYFLRYYWNQVVVYKLKQDQKTTKQTLIVKILEEKAKGTSEYYQTFFSRDENKDFQQELIKEISNKCFTDVIPRFQRDSKQNIYLHNARIGKRKDGGIRYYQPQKDFRYITFKKDSLRKIAKEYYLLKDVLILSWSKFLEKSNFTPKLIEKVENLDIKRHSLQRMRKILLEFDENKCFYCGCNLVEEKQTHVDHFIPWSFILDDESIWNLVLSCSNCNLRKNNKLPKESCLNKLLERNLTLPKGKRVYPDHIRNYYNECVNAGFIVGFEECK